MIRFWFPTSIFAFITLLGLTNSAKAQTVSGDMQAQNIQNALVTLSGNPVLNIQLTGTKTVGTRKTNLFYDSYFENLPSENSSSLNLKLAIFAYVNGAVTKEWIADGTNLWIYTFSTNKYMVENYTSKTNEAPMDSLVQKISGLTDEYSGAIVTLLRQTYGSSGPHFESWLGGGILHTPPTIGEVTYETSNQSYSFDWVIDSYKQTALQSVNYYSFNTLGGYDLQTQWQLIPTPVAPSQLPANVFKFVPPVGALPISIGR